MPDVWLLLSIPLKFVVFLGVFATFGLVLNFAVRRRETAQMRGRLYRIARVLAILALIATVFGHLVKGAALAGSMRGMVDKEIIDVP